MKSSRDDLTGQVFSRLTVLEFAGLRHRQSRWLCACSCGKEKTVFGGNLKSGATRSCGCLIAETVGNRSRKHGLSKTPEYKVWRAMFQRCEDRSSKSYRRYGGRGISICGRWRTFENFLADMGKRPSKTHSIDRVNNDGNYEPSNCRWATRKQQYENTINVRPFGRFPSQSAAARRLGISLYMVRKRQSLRLTKENTTL